MARLSIPSASLLLSSNNDGTVSVIQETDAQTLRPLGSIKTQVTGKNMWESTSTPAAYMWRSPTLDPNAPVPAGANGRPGRPRPLPGTLKILFLDPEH